MKTVLSRLLLSVASAYAGLCLLVFLTQRRMLYFPQRESMDSALQEARLRHLEPWQDETGSFLGWRARHPTGAAAGCLLVLHGNAGSALDRTYFRAAFQDPNLPLALDVLLLEYPGYGPRDGTPTEAAILEAATAALDRAGQEFPGAVFLAGESLGSAAAALAAARRPDRVKGLLLMTPLKNVPAVARRHYPFLPPALARDTFRADLALNDLRLPVGFLLAGRDEVVFPDLGRQLFEAYKGPKRLWTDEQAFHNTLDFSPALPQWRDMVVFLAHRW